MQVIYCLWCAQLVALPKLSIYPAISRSSVFEHLYCVFLSGLKHPMDVWSLASELAWNCVRITTCVSIWTSSVCKWIAPSPPPSHPPSQPPWPGQARTPAERDVCDSDYPPRGESGATCPEGHTQQVCQTTGATQWWSWKREEVRCPAYPLTHYVRMCSHYLTLHVQSYIECFLFPWKGLIVCTFLCCQVLLHRLQLCLSY